MDITPPARLCKCHMGSVNLSVAFRTGTLHVLYDEIVLRCPRLPKMVLRVNVLEKNQYMGVTYTGLPLCDGTIVSIRAQKRQSSTQEIGNDGTILFIESLYFVALQK